MLSLLSRDASFRWLRTHRVVGMSVTLATPAAISTLNRRFRGRAKPTDVLSFPQFPSRGALRRERIPHLELGDIVIAPAVVRRKAAAGGVSFYAQFSWVLAHGILHVLGFDHERSAREARRMRNREREMLAALRIS